MFLSSSLISAKSAGQVIVAALIIGEPEQLEHLPGVMTSRADVAVDADLMMTDDLLPEITFYLFCRDQVVGPVLDLPSNSPARQRESSLKHSPKWRVNSFTISPSWCRLNLDFFV